MAKKPLAYQMAVEDEVLRELRSVLERAVEDIEKELSQPLSGAGVGEALSRANAEAIATAARAHLTRDWADIREILGGARKSAAMAATRSFYSQLEGPLKQLLGDDGYGSLVDAQATMAATRINTVMARLSSSRRSLSNQVWRTRAQTNGWLDSKINQALARGWDAQRLAKEVVGFVNPDTPGGASYAAKRLARTEINNAFHSQTIEQMHQSGVVEYVKWNLSGSHPDRDICDDMAEHRLGKTDLGNKPSPDKGRGSQPSLPYDDLDSSIYEDSGWTEGEFRDKRVSARDWRFAKDIDDRAAILLQGNYASERMVKSISANISRGRDPWSGVEVDQDWLGDYTKAPRSFGELRGKYSLSEQQIRDQLELAARRSLAWEREILDLHYKGLRLEEGWQSSFTPGSVHDLWQSSFTPDLYTAEKYASGEFAEGALPAMFDRVIVEISDARGSIIKSPLERLARESLLSGEIEVLSLEGGEDGTFRVKARQK